MIIWISFALRWLKRTALLLISNQFCRVGYFAFDAYLVLGWPMCRLIHRWISRNRIKPSSRSGPWTLAQPWRNGRLLAINWLLATIFIFFASILDLPLQQWNLLNFQSRQGIRWSLFTNPWLRISSLIFMTWHQINFLNEFVISSFQCSNTTFLSTFTHILKVLHPVIANEFVGASLLVGLRWKLSHWGRFDPWSCCWFWVNPFYFFIWFLGN